MQVDPIDKTPSSFMWDHLCDTHHGEVDGEIKDNFRFEIISSHRDPLERQIMEATRINQALDRGSLQNTKDKPSPVVSLNRRHEQFSPIERWEESTTGF